MVSITTGSYNVRCNICGNEYNIIADRVDMEAWLSGEKYIQDALSYLSSAERELLISQPCNSCWIEMYGLDDEE